MAKFPARTRLLLGALACLAAFLATGCSRPAPGGEEARASAQPNVVFILADDMRKDDFEYMPRTRQLLSEEGATFENAFVTTPLCCPSRASILRGQYTQNHQVLTNAAPEGGFDKFRSEGHESSTIATWLRDEGYRTVLLGKYLNGYARAKDETYVPPGWDEWYGMLRQEGYYNYRMNENGTVVSYGDAEEDYQTDVLARKARDYVRRTAGAEGSEEPFFMYLAPGAPHGPFVPAPRHENTYQDARAPRPPSFDEPDIEDKPAWLRNLPRLGSAEGEAPAGAGEEPTSTAEESPPVPEEGIVAGAEDAIDNAYRNRLRMLLSLDELVAGLVEELAAAGELDNTYVFFTSDNGYQLGERRIAQGKRTAYEESIRVPLAVRGPGVPAGRTVQEMALNLDLAPTIAELGGATAPPFIDGRSLAPFLSDDPPAAWRSSFLFEHYSGGNAQPRLAPTYAAVRTTRYKYVEYDSGEKELYDLYSDPYELENVYETADPTLKADLEARLEALKNCAGDSCRKAEDAP